MTGILYHVMRQSKGNTCLAVLHTEDMRLSTNPDHKPYCTWVPDRDAAALLALSDGKLSPSFGLLYDTLQGMCNELEAVAEYSMSFRIGIHGKSLALYVYGVPVDGHRDAAGQHLLNCKSQVKKYIFAKDVPWLQALAVPLPAFADGQYPVAAYSPACADMYIVELRLIEQSFQAPHRMARPAVSNTQL